MSARNENAWTYMRDRTGAAFERAFWSGDVAPALGAHFHPDAQLTVIFAGARSFEIRSQHFTARAGQCLYIPAAAPHKSLPLAYADTNCLNIYAPDFNLGRSPLVFDAGPLAGDARDADPAALLSLIRRQATSAVERGVASPPPRGFEWRRATIGEIAARNGASREAFSRKFAAEFGMPPHAYRIVDRLNAARRRLAEGDSLAALAAEFDFADQSHFGRHFRRVFGVTPRDYRESMR